MAYKKSAANSCLSKQYQDLMKRCDLNLEKMDAELPPAKSNFNETRSERGITRRSFVKWSSMMTAALMLPPVFSSKVAKAAENFSRLPVVWLHFAECTGCSESLLRTSYPNIDDILLETISLEYHETLMAASGHQAEACLEKAVHDFKGKFLCVIEGALPTGMDGKYLTLGSKGKTGIETAIEVASKAAGTICIGSCSSYGGVQAAHPNPTKAKGINEAFAEYGLDAPCLISAKDSFGCVRHLNIPGCPPNSTNFVGTLLHFLLFGSLPPADVLRRPVWAYGKRIHDFCERRPHYDAGEYVEEWGDQGAQKTWCLYKMGCKGPYTFSNCSKVKFNDGISWPVQAGHGCIGCTEPSFWDTMKPFEKPISAKTIGGGEKTVDKIGTALVGITAAGIATHGVITAVKKHKPEK